jgi:Rrf2 family protein
MATNSRFEVAVHVLTLMAKAGNEPIKSEAVAESVNTNPVVIRRLLCELARASLVVSQTGASGGSRLSRTPHEITLLDVYRAVEPRKAFCLHRRKPNGHCPVGAQIETVLSDVFDDVNGAVETVLSKSTMGDVLERTGSCGNGESKG